MVQEGVNVLVQLAGIGAGPQLFIGLALFWGEDIGGTESLPGGLRLAVAALDSRAYVGSGDDSLLGQAQDGLEEVVVEPQLLVEGIEGQSLSHRVQAVMAEVGPYQG